MVCMLLVKAGHMVGAVLSLTKVSCCMPWPCRKLHLKIEGGILPRLVLERLFGPSSRWLGVGEGEALDATGSVSDVNTFDVACIPRVPARLRVVWGSFGRANLMHTKHRCDRQVSTSVYDLSQGQSDERD